jgi:hypothetical protein
MVFNATFINKQSLEEELQDTKGVVRIRKSKKGRQHNDKKKKRTQNDLQNIAYDFRDQRQHTTH